MSNQPQTEEDYIKICNEIYIQAKITHNIKILDSLIKQYETPRNTNFLDSLRDKYYLLLDNIILKNQIKINKHNAKDFYDLKHDLEKLGSENKNNIYTNKILEKLTENGLKEDPSWPALKRKLLEQFPKEVVNPIDEVIILNSQQSLTNIKKANEEKTPIKDGLKEMYMPAGFGGGLLMISQVVKTSEALLVAPTIMLGGAIILGVLGKEKLKQTYNTVKEMIFSKDAFLYLSRETENFLKINQENINSRIELFGNERTPPASHKSVKAISAHIRSSEFLNKIHSFLLTDKQNYICTDTNFITKIPKILKINVEKQLEKSLDNSLTKITKFKI